MIADPVAAHIAELGRELRGPARARQSMLAEARDGLLDAADAYRECGLEPRAAATRAVGDFGSVREIAPLFQDELTVRQGRWLAVQLALVFPGMVLAWDVLWSSGVRWPGPVSPFVSVLARGQDVLCGVVAAALLVLLALTFRRAASPRALTRAIAIIGVVGGSTAGGMAVAMNVAAWPDHEATLAAGPAAVPAFGTSALVLMLIVFASVRALRVARVR
jgi:hypothetical protein